ncbi:hypothetical protein EBR43_03155, partial [bacterium]|nr:hypothetical protein [bacterium]
MYEVGDPVLYKGKEKFAQDMMEYPAVITEVKQTDSLGNIIKPSDIRYTIRLAPKKEQPNGEYPNINSSIGTIIYGDGSVSARQTGVIRNVRNPELIMTDQIFEPMEEEGEPKIRVTKVSGLPYYKFLGKQIEKNDAIKEIEEDVKNIIDKKLNIDPIFFLDILESIFEVNVIIFCRDRELSKEGTMCSPNFRRNYILNTKKGIYSETVILYRTNGGEFDKVPYPHIELLCLESDV